MTSPRRRSTSESPPAAADRPVDPQRQEELAFTHCLRRLTGSARTEAELTESMRTRGYRADVIDTVLGRLRAARYVDDREFARSWVESRTRTRALAAPALRFELLAKGVSDDLIDEALGAQDVDLLDGQAHRLVRRKLGAAAQTFDDLDRAEQQRITRRLVAMLARKGHPSGSAYAIVQDVLAAERERG